MSLTETYCRELGVAEALLPQLLSFAERGGAPAYLLEKAREFNQRTKERDDELFALIDKEVPAHAST